MNELFNNKSISPTKLLTTGGYMKRIAKKAFILSTFISQTLWAESVCPEYISNDWADSRYQIETISDDTVVTDKEMGLMWKQCSEGLTGDNCTQGVATAHTWEQALGLVETMSFAGFTDWRVPNLNELVTIVARNCFNPSINETAFPNTPIDKWFWSSSPVKAPDDIAWIVTFNTGGDTAAKRNKNLHVRLVRSVQ